MNPDDSSVGLLYSGGLDSAILLAHLLASGRGVQPFYIQSDLVWQQAELRSARRFLTALNAPRLAELVVLEMPLLDVYGGHWSTTGDGTPDAATPDEAVYLPGRNALLILKAAVWCQLHGLTELALAPLATNPFADATAGFFDDLQAALNRGAGSPLRIVRPFGDLHKDAVMRLGKGYPLELTFSCIAPRGNLHCGRCNKCAERQAAFAAAGLPDATAYAGEAGSGTPAPDWLAPPGPAVASDRQPG